MLQLFVEPADAGHAGVARLRTYVYYYNITRLQYLQDVFDLYQSITYEIQKVVATQPQDYLVSTEATRDLDLMSFALKRKQTFQREP